MQLLLGESLYDVEVHFMCDFLTLPPDLDKQERRKRKELS
jgi:hypothetical protein